MGFNSSGFKAAVAKSKANEAAKKQAANDAKAVKAKSEDDAFNKLQSEQRAGVRLSRQTGQEKKAGVVAPSFEGMRDVNTGELLKDYTFDPYSGEAVQALKGEAFGTSKESPWLKLQREREMQGMDSAAKQSLQGMSQAQAGLAMTGGLSSGARERMARGGAKDLMLAKQGITREGTQARLGRQGELLGSFADLEKQAQLQNIQTRQADLGATAMFDSNRYNQQMSAWGAKQTADAQRAAAASQKTGKCFSRETLISMADGSTKQIQDIQVGDEVLQGGKVLEVLQHNEETPVDLYDYAGARVTGSHAVKEDGRWVRVNESLLAKTTFISTRVLFNLVTEKHVIVSKDAVFSDNEETFENYKNERMSLAALNGVQF